MIFNSVQYVAFLAVVVGIYWRLPRRGQNLLVLVASYVFYGAWDARFLVLIAISTVVDFVVGTRLGREGTSGRSRRGWLVVSIAVNLGILGFFKYAGFFATSFAALAAKVGVEVSPFVLDVVLPVGISFYTFQTLSYTIDVYRGRFPPTHDLLDFATYVAFFPQLVAGPIERAANLLPQFAHQRRRPDAATLRSGLGLIALGLVMKVVVADALGPYVDDAYAAPREMGGLHMLLATYAFGLQIYADFAGYTAVARGSARLLGVELMRNFEQPYLSTNITDFWRTWHISLSTWLRDYLYIPLGGNRGTAWRTGRNLMITMLLGGLWHGASWNFVIWGGLHGAFLVVHRRLRRPERRRDLALRDLPSILVTFHAVTFAWIFFRAPTFADARSVIGAIVTWRDRDLPLDLPWVLAAAVVLTLTIDLAQRRTGWQLPFPTWPRVARGLAYGTAAVLFVVFSGQPIQPFIYFQF
ncbi:MBOAT family O-acyltransferase [Nitriliruptor alkaliphilus]|uniref:MBOAT family O-acyltransferase n=1 Tax=Nitriliruptor alkaliphilus TaxID=427918 RepID=UPI000698A0EA|nr:MBOAT family protein [Nitriliruptor alkaliphilus]